MVIKTDYNALVLVGAWNKSIFSPEWVSKFLLPNEKTFTVELSLNIDASPRISCENIRIWAIGNKLNFTLRDTKDETFELIQNLAIKTADYLPHTPVTSFGINFIFENDVNENLSEIFKLNDTKRLIEFGASIETKQLKHSIIIEEKLINFTVSIDSIIKFELNFHFNISNLIEFKELIISNNILDLKRMALSIMREVYSLELNE